jgi:hypothetical protein
MRRTAICVLILLAVTQTPSARQAPAFAGFWSDKDPGGTGGLFYGMSWDDLVSRWKELGARNQYLADVEVYPVKGETRYAAVWRIGRGNGALWASPWTEFARKWTEWKSTQDLIDLEVYESGGRLMYLGVFRHKQETSGDGGLLAGLTWQELVAKRKEFAPRAYLSDVETYMDRGTRKFVGVWRPGRGTGALYLMDDWMKFAETKASLDRTQELIDFDMFQTGASRWSFLGVWRDSAAAGPLVASTSRTTFVPLDMAELVERWKRLQATHTLTGLAVGVPSAPPVLVGHRVETPTLRTLRGDTKCAYGDPDCNPCATDVATQFRLAFETGHRPWIGWHDGSWSFKGNDRYPPDDLKPEVVFSPYGEDGQAGIVSKHIQTFVRTNSSRIPYAGSHSHKSTGSIFFVERDGGANKLHSIYKSGHDHPSGVAVLGDGVFVAEGDDLRRFRLSAAGKDANGARFTVPKSDVNRSIDPGDDGRGLQGGGGGVGLVKLADGSTLLIVTAPGGGFRDGATKAAREDNERPRYTRLYQILPNAFADTPQMVFLGEWTHEGVSARPDSPRAYSENLSAITECRTGHLYTIHTTGEYALKGNGYWRLSRLEGSPEEPRFVHIQTARQSQNNESCHHRSSATVSVNQKGELEFLCSERAVIKWHPTGRFDFREGKR